MIYLPCVMRGQLDPVFSFKDECKSEQDYKIKCNMYRYWNAVSVGYAQYLTIIPQTLMGHEGERNNCFSKIQLVGPRQKDFSWLKLDFNPFLSLVGYNI